MNITEIKSEIAGDSYYKVEHPSGLTIFVYPKEGYTSSYAIFGTRYGSINTKFSVNGGDIITVPDGIAHYLEHKLFESEEGDAFVRYAKTGANANAYTSFEKTCYLFSCPGSLLYGSDSCKGTGHYRSGNQNVRRLSRLASNVQYA